MNTCTPIFTAALFTIAMTQKQPKCPSTEECVKKIWYTHTMKYHSDIKNEIMPFQQHVPRDYHTESNRERQISHDITYMWNLKTDTNELIYKTETDSDFKYKLWLPKGKGGGRDKLGGWD